MGRYYWIAAAVLAADGLTKALAQRLAEPVTLIPGVIGLRLAGNSGMAFSLLSGRPWLLLLLSLALLAGGALALKGRRLGSLSRWGAMLVLGGAAGNLTERLLSGQVTDMVETLFVSFPIFNLADVAVVTGCALLALSLWLKPQEWEPREEAAHE